MVKRVEESKKESGRDLRRACVYKDKIEWVEDDNR